jgi:hypothetical protein
MGTEIIVHSVLIVKVLYEADVVCSQATVVSAVAMRREY